MYYRSMDAADSGTHYSVVQLYCCDCLHRSAVLLARIHRCFFARWWWWWWRWCNNAKHHHRRVWKGTRKQKHTERYSQRWV